MVVWEHNSHIGDARATQMAQRGELNIGQLMRERHPRDVVLVGFTTHAGTVTAASAWGEPAERMRVRPAPSTEATRPSSTRSASAPSCSARSRPVAADRRCASPASSARSA